MILKLGLEYWRLKTVPLSRFIYNTLLESSLFEKKTGMTRENYNTCQILARLDSQPRGSSDLVLIT